MRAHCPRCEDLEHELAYYRSEVKIVDDLDAIRRLRAHGLRGDTEAKIVLHLLRCRHHTATKLQLADLLWAAETSTGKSVDVFICRLRKTLGHDAIETLWGSGFRMTQAGLDKVYAMLSD